ncbi:hypothetical protein ABH926_004834 [Catenulispora sp. GP43]|uniref:peptidoglycan-binding protein n=1 Tax=Catenulispora sp. GP43 TaxID=3156263 RepID=UPI0035184005
MTPLDFLRRHRLAIPIAAVVLGTGVAVAQFADAAPAKPATQPGLTGSWISFAGGKLSYGHDAQGNRIPDYSSAGYEGGGVAIPSVATKDSVKPTGGDDTKSIQAAIDKVSALPLNAQGFRGAVQLAAGTFRLAGSLHITASGVVLRGASTNAAATTLVAIGATARTLVTIGSTAAYAVVGAQAKVTDTYVPVGGTSLTLDDASGLKAGDQVVVERPTTQAWIDALGMQSDWKPNWSLRSERTITAVSGNRITIDAPLTTALEKQYTQALVYRYTFPRIDHVGLENLTADGQAMTTDPKYATDFYDSQFAMVDAVQDSWVDNVFGWHFGQNGAAGLTAASRRVSVLHTGSLDMVTTGTSARSNGYTLSGQENLIQDCEVTASKVHAFETEQRQSGPNVYSDCTATLIPSSYSASFDSGGHQRWGGGTLYDDVVLQGSLNMEDYGSEGSGHGWGDANSTAWNCGTTGLTLMEPPTAHNWAVGCTGALAAGSDGQVESAGSHVLPTSLYAEQLAERGK